MKTFHGAVPKVKSRKSKKARGRARPDEALRVYCEVARAEVCTGRSEVRHHKLRRSQGGTDDVSNTIDCCSACHSWIHENPSKAFAWGFLLHRGNE